MGIRHCQVGCSPQEAHRQTPQALIPLRSRRSDAEARSQGRASGNIIACASTRHCSEVDGQKNTFARSGLFHAPEWLPSRIYCPEEATTARHVFRQLWIDDASVSQSAL